MAVKVGTFAKSTNTSVPVSQSVTGVGFKPRALILWTSGATSTGSFADNYKFSIGIAGRDASETVTYGSVSIASQDAQATSNASKAHNAKALCIVEWGESIVAECDLATFDADGFTLSWTTNDSNAYLIHYMALAGDNMTDAGVVSFALDTSTGDQAVTGVGFQPDCVLFISSKKTTGTGAAADAAINIGVMTSSAQITVSGQAWDSEATMVTQGFSSENYVIYSGLTNGLADMVATYVSMDADGFTFNISNAPASGYLYYGLCLKGGSYFVDNFASVSTSPPVDQSKTGVGFQPEGLLLLGRSLSLIAGSASTADLAVNVSATDGTGQAAALVTDEDGVADSNTAAYASSAAICVADNAADQTLNNAATIKSLDADGFTVTWSVTSVSAFPFLAFAGGSVSGGGGGGGNTIPPIAMNYFGRRGILG